MRILGLIVLMWGAQAFGRSDLIVRMSPIDQSVSGQLNAEYELENVGDAVAEGFICVKGMMVPAQPKGEHFQGSSLKTMRFQISIPPGAKQTFSYSSALPTLKAGDYRAALIINSRSGIDERNQLNNVSNVGSLTIADDFVNNNLGRDVNFDLVAEVTNAQILPINGGLMHGLRTIARGDISLFPSDDLPDEKLWARFFVYSYSENMFIPLIYEGNSKRKIEKDWFSVAWEEEENRHGQKIFVDYYSQAPNFSHVKPGDYYLVTLINSRDRIPENNTFNNLDLEHVIIGGVTSTREEIWSVSLLGESNDDLFPKTLPIALMNQYKTPLTWTANVPFGADWVTVASLQGVIEGPGQYVTYGVKPPAVAGEHVGAIDFIASTPFAAKHTVTLRHFIYDDEMPLVDIDKTYDSAEFAEGEYDKTIEFTLSNVGTADLKWRVTGRDPNVHYLTIKPSEGTIAPGASQVVTFHANRDQLGQGFQTQKVSVITNSQNVPITLSADFVVPYAEEGK